MNYYDRKLPLELLIQQYSVETAEGDSVRSRPPLPRLKKFAVAMTATGLKVIHLIPCTACNGTGECQGIAARESCGDGCNCTSFDDCPTYGECVLCDGEGTEEDI